MFKPLKPRTVAVLMTCILILLVAAEVLLADVIFQLAALAATV